MNSNMGDLGNIGVMNENSCLHHCFCLSYISFNMYIEDISILNSRPFYFIAQKIMILWKLMAYNNYYLFVNGCFQKISLVLIMNYFVNNMYLDTINLDKIAHLCNNIKEVA
jgi:hypothetical protein